MRHGVTWEGVRAADTGMGLPESLLSELLHVVGHELCDLRQIERPCIA